MTGFDPFDVIADLLYGEDRDEERNPARDRARNVQAGLAIMAQKLDDIDAQVNRWGNHVVRMIPEPGPGFISLVRLQDIGNLIGVDVPGPTAQDLVNFLRGGIQAIRDSLRGASDKLKPYVDHPGNPDRIAEVADIWNGEIQRSVSGLIEWFSEETLIVDNAWDGPAANAYRDFFPGQQKAARTIAVRADDLGRALSRLASAIDEFWQELDNDVTGAVRKLTGMSISLLSPDFLSAGSDILGELNDRIDDLVKSLADARETYQAAVDQLVSDMNDNEHFPGGRWPIPSAMGGISDRPTDWTPTPPERSR